MAWYALVLYDDVWLELRVYLMTLQVNDVNDVKEVLPEAVRFQRCVYRCCQRQYAERGCESPTEEDRRCFSVSLFCVYVSGKLGNPASWGISKLDGSKRRIALSCFGTYLWVIYS